METATKINVPEIRRVLAHIEENVLRLQMEQWGVKKNEYTAARYEFPVCGTRACLAGWTVLLNTPEEQ